MKLTYLYKLLTIQAIATLLACADATTSTPTPPQSTADMMTAGTPVIDMTIPTGGMTGGTVIPSARELQILGDINLFVPVNTQKPLKVRLIAGGNTPIANTRISFTMYNAQRQPAPQGVDGSFLSSQNALTNALGEAEVSVTAGPTGTSFTVQATDTSSPDTPAVTWNVNVASSDKGGLSIDVKYDTMTGRLGYSQFSAAKVALFEGIDCNVLQERAPNLVGAYLELAQINPFNDINRVANASDLPKDTQFSVTAVILNQAGSPVAFGCQRTQIMGGQTTTVNVLAKDLPLSYNKGTYTVVHRFNVIQSLQSTGDENLSQIANVLELLRLLGGSGQQVGSAVIDQVCMLADVQGATCDLVGDLLGGLVGEVIINILPPEVRNVLTIMGDILNIAANLTFIGEFAFRGNPDANGLMTSNDNRWQKIRFGWQGMQQEVTLGQLGDRNSRPIAGIFDAQVMGEKVEILPHSFEIRYGDIMLGIMETWILPIYYGTQGTPVTLLDFLQDTIPCDRINEAVGLDPNSTLCRNILITTLSRVLEDQISRLNFNASDLTMTGSFTPADQSGDLSVDLLDEGQWNASLTNGFVFKGCFKGCLNAECMDSSCEIAP